MDIRQLCVCWMCMLYFFKAWKFIIENGNVVKKEDKVEGKLYVQYLWYISMKNHYSKKSLNINKKFLVSPHSDESYPIDFHAYKSTFSENNVEKGSPF